MKAHGKTFSSSKTKPIIAMMETKQLEKAGYHVRKAMNGKAAIDLVDSNPEAVDLILMDIDLGPGMDGTETASEILKAHEVPVVFLSSHVEKDIVQKTEKITSYGYVVKNSGLVVLDASIKMAFKLFAAHRSIQAQKTEIEVAYEDLKSAERRLMKSEELFRKAFMTSPDSININRLDDGTYVNVNEGFTKIVGYTLDEIFGKTSVDINIWVDPEDRFRLVKKIMEKGQVENLEAKFRKKKRQRRHGPDVGFDHQSGRRRPHPVDHPRYRGHAAFPGRHQKPRGRSPDHDREHLRRDRHHGRLGHHPVQ